MNKQYFKKVLNKELLSILTETVCKNDDGTYELFGSYTLQPEDSRYSVSKHKQKIGVFNNTKTAVSWCIADKYHLRDLANEIVMIDRKIYNLNVDIHVRSTIAERSNEQDLKELVDVKLQYKLKLRKDLEERLANCINLAKYWQRRGFNNEITRTSVTIASKADYSSI